MVVRINIFEMILVGDIDSYITKDILYRSTIEYQ